MKKKNYFNFNCIYSFRHLLSQETSTPNMHRSLVAIKEHGILISSENYHFPPFWVIGFVSFSLFSVIVFCIIVFFSFF